MKPKYEALVIGTGFGGSVSACRLAQARVDVGVLERGRRYAMGAYPRNWKDPLDGWLWSHGQGLFDVKPINEMLIVQGAGYGGGSLIYANVHLRAPADLFTTGWPAGYSRAVLDPYYDLAAYMLDITPISATQPLGLPVKSRRMAEVAEALGRMGQFCYPNLAVDFSAPGVVHKNKFGVDQTGCTHCGECDIGCNVHAKNTLDLNYLAIAEERGADINLRCEALKIESLDGGGYRVSVRDHSRGGAECEIEARQVFLCAGAVNSTELLLRCRDQYHTLPKLSPVLGHGYSGNGDMLAFAFDTREEFLPSDGPTITTGIVHDRDENGVRSWFIFEEGGYPREIGNLVSLLDPSTEWLARFGHVLRADLDREIGIAARAHVGPNNPPKDSAVFLMMGRDRANGRITLVPVTHQLRVLWDVPSNLPLYDVQMRFAKDVADTLGGRGAANPFWRRLHQPVSVHNLGGCTMADDPAHGVTDSDGQVYGYRGLYVLDGGILPAATGVNPSHTITAVAERNIERVIRAMPGREHWQAPERVAVQPIQDPVTKLAIPIGSTPATRALAVGIQFTETMKGFVKRGATPEGGYATAERAGQQAGTRVEFTLTITIPSLDDFLTDKAHTGNAKGTVHVDGLTGPDGVPVTAGVFNLFVETGALWERKTLYALPFYGTDGQPYLLDGFKEVKDHGHFDVWGATSTLYTVAREGHGHDGRVLATGVAHILIQDFVHELGTFRVTGTDSRLEQAKAIARFGGMFMGTLWDVFIRAKF